MKRFINADGFASTGQGFLGYNVFAYCKNSPVKHVDASGDVVSVAVILGITGLVALCSSLVWLSTPSGQKALNETQKLIAETYSEVKQVVIDYAENTSIDPNETRNHSVYVLYDSSHDVVYVGRTNEVLRRQYEHSRDPDKAGLIMDVKATGLTEKEARLVEQSLISAYSLYYLYNMRREIARRNISKFNIYYKKLKQLYGSISDEGINRLLEK